METAAAISIASARAVPLTQPRPISLALVPISVSQLDVSCFLAAVLEIPQYRVISITPGEDWGLKLESERVAIIGDPSPAKRAVREAWHEKILQVCLPNGSDGCHSL